MPSQPFAGLGQEVTLASILTRLRQTNLPLSDAEALAVRNVPKFLWDCSFANVIANNVDAAYFNLIQTGAGQTVAQTGGNLVLTTGVTPNSETVIRSKRSFNSALTFRQVTTLSQRIANQNFFAELVDVIGDGLAYNIISATTVDVTKPAHGFTAANAGQRMDLCAITGAAGVPVEGVIASIPDTNTIRFTVSGWPATGTGTLSLTGWNKVEVVYNGTTATTVAINTRRRGWQNASTAVSINSTGAPHQAIVNLDNGMVSILDKSMSYGAGISGRGWWDANIPPPETPLYIQLRSKNGPVAPASTTTWTIGMVRVEDYNPVEVNLGGVRPHAAPQALNVTMGVSGSRIGFVAKHAIQYSDTTTNLAASATFTGTSRDLSFTTAGAAITSTSTHLDEVRVLAETDVSGGTLALEVSLDGTNWSRIAAQAVAAVAGGGYTAAITHKIAWRYARVIYVNGATATGRLRIGSQLTS